ncbi:MAG: hypothetical protein R2824_27025 [Saprospiraceae bacterium]
MKTRRIVFTLIGVLAVISMAAQEHFVIPADYGLWKYVQWVDPGIEYGQFTYKVQGDTTINSKSYKKLLLNDSINLGAVIYEAPRLKVITSRLNAVIY